MFSMCDHLSLLFWGKAHYSKENILKYNDHHIMDLGKQKRERGRNRKRERELIIAFHQPHWCPQEAPSSGLISFSQFKDKHLSCQITLNQTVHVYSMDKTVYKLQIVAPAFQLPTGLLVVFLHEKLCCCFKTLNSFSEYTMRNHC